MGMLFSIVCKRAFAVSATGEVASLSKARSANSAAFGKMDCAIAPSA